MNVLSDDSKTEVDTPADPQQQLLQLARQLDRFGCGAEEFFSRQFELLERGISEFEREKAAWRRQLRRESRQLVRQREELNALRERVSGSGTQADKAITRTRKGRSVAATVRASGTHGLRLLIRPRQATSRQVGLLLFEMSKLNRDMGGQGLIFEPRQVRKRRGWRLWRRSGAAAGEEILEVEGQSALPLTARGLHVALDVDVTDRVENWLAFKTRLLQSCFSRHELAAEFRKSRPVADSDSSSIIQDAVGQLARDRFATSDYSTASMFSHTTINAAQQQLDRLECCYESLRSDTGLQVHIELAAPA